MRAQRFIQWLAKLCATVQPQAAHKAEGGLTTSNTLVMQVSDALALRCLEAQAHRRPWASLGWVRRYCRYSERASCFITTT
jgi:hypothetical protein